MKLRNVMLKRGKLCRSEGLKLIKYLGILESDKFKEKEIKDIPNREHKAVQT